ncbi:MAG TPA: dipeptidase [Sphingomicrobium sp.]|jgi:membrane dipeptidase|nr:dipeptidase [Sphingomicrobium sp.]
MAMRHFLLLAGALAMIPGALQAQSIDPRVQARIDRILKATPLIDGHNDLPEQLRENYNMSVGGLASGTDKRPDHPLMTDMARLHQGHVGGQFWSVYIPSELTGDAAIRATLEQIDIVKRLVKAYPNDLELARTADDVVRIHKAGRIASLIGVEGGHQIGGSLAALRQFYDLGARYMTLSHFKNNEFADSATDDPKYHGLNDFGRTVVHEMNRLGMLVDLSHVSPETMAAALDVSKAPVIFSHSDARALADHPRNVPDDILKRLQSNGGVVMVNFYLGHLSETYRQWEGQHSAEEALLADLDTGQPAIRKAKLAEWEHANPAPMSNVGIIADHIEHIVKIAGHDHVGLGGDLDGIPFDGAPPGMNSVSGYPLVFAELIRRGWSDEDLAKLAGGNLLRVLRQAEAVSASMKDEPPATARLQPLSPTDPWK